MIAENILIKETEEKFGYSPFNLRPSSEKLVISLCPQCKTVKPKKFRSAQKQPLCLPCSNKNNSRQSSAKRSEALKLWFKENDHPRLGSTMTPEHSKKLADMAKNRTGKANHNYGKRSNHGRGFWFEKGDYKCFCRSKWERSAVDYFEDNGIKWVHEPKVFEIIYFYKGELKEGTYTPDFYLPELNVWWEIKGWWRDDAQAKYDAFRKQYPEENVKLMFEKDLKEHGIKTRWWRKDELEKHRHGIWF